MLVACSLERNRKFNTCCCCLLLFWFKFVILGILAIWLPMVWRITKWYFCHFFWNVAEVITWLYIICIMPKIQMLLVLCFKFCRWCRVLHSRSILIINWNVFIIANFNQEFGCGFNRHFFGNLYLEF